MKEKIGSKDPDIIGSLPAMRRAARNARKLAIEMGTPFYVVIEGKIVNQNPAGRRRKPPPVRLTP
jgi:hypothetical protein